MARLARITLQEDFTAWLVTTKVVGGSFLLGDVEKEQMLNLIRELSSIFFVHIHTYCIMSNHFHLVLSARNKEAALASREELMERYGRLRGDPNALPPSGGIRTADGSMIADADGGLERLRRRLGDPARFMQELNQRFSLLYNLRHERSGAFWKGRFHSVLLGDPWAQLVGSAYVDLNPVRAGIVSWSEGYRWCGLGSLHRGEGWREGRDEGFLYPLPLFQEGTDGPEFRGRMSLSFYRGFVAVSGAKPIPGKACLAPKLVREILALHQRLGIGHKLLGRIRNISESIVLGAAELVEMVQRRRGRKTIGARCLMGIFHVSRLFREGLHGPLFKQLPVADHGALPTMDDG